MLITPSAVPYKSMTADHIVFVDQNGTAEQTKQPSSEFRFHLACYRTRTDINAVVHTHAVNSTALSVLGRSIPAVHYMIAAAGSVSVPCVPYAPFGTEELSEYVARGIKKAGLFF